MATPGIISKVTLGAWDKIDRLPSSVAQISTCGLAVGTSIDCIRRWEMYHKLTLPQDMVSFLLVTNGLVLEWRAKLFNSNWLEVGRLFTPSLAALVPIDKWPSSPVTSAAASNGTAAKSEGYLHGNNDGQTMCTADTCGDLVASVSSSQVAESEEARESKQSKTDLTGSPTETRAPGPCQQNHVSPNQEKNSHLPACSFRGVRSYYGALPTLRQQHIDDIISDLKSRNAWPTEDGADSSKMLDPSQRISDVQLAGTVASRNMDGLLRWIRIDTAADAGIIVLDCCCLNANWSSNANYGSVWLVESSGVMHKLAVSFTDYFRLQTVHLGLSHWQLLLAPSLRPPPYAMFWFQRFIPARLRIDRQATDKNVDNYKSSTKRIASNDIDFTLTRQPAAKTS